MAPQAPKNAKIACFGGNISQKVQVGMRTRGRGPGGPGGHIQTTTFLTSGNTSTYRLLLFLADFHLGLPPPWEVELAPAPAYAKEGVGTDRSRKQGVRPSKNLARKWSFWQRGYSVPPPGSRGGKSNRGEDFRIFQKRKSTVNGIHPNRGGKNPIGGGENWCFQRKTL